MAIDEIERITDSLVENIINTPDAEILKEVEEDYGDKNYLADKMRNILEKAKKSTEKAK